MQLVEPKVSTASNRLHKTFFSASFLAVSVKPIVTYKMSPSGTFAVIIPIANMKFKIGGYPTANPNANKTKPIVIANTVSRMINLFIYL